MGPRWPAQSMGPFQGQAAGPVAASLLALAVNCFAQGGDLAKPALKRAG